MTPTIENPFIVKARKKAAREMWAPFDRGDRVTVTWKDIYDTEQTFTGKIREKTQNDWALLINERGVKWHWPMTFAESVRAAS